MSERVDAGWDIAALDAACQAHDLAAESARQTEAALAARAAESVRTLDDLDASRTGMWPAKMIEDGFGGYLTPRAARDGRTRRGLALRAERESAQPSGESETAVGWPHTSEFANPRGRQTIVRSSRGGRNGGALVMLDRDGDPVIPATLREIRRLHERRIISKTEARGMLGLGPRGLLRLLSLPGRQRDH